MADQVATASPGPASSNGSSGSDWPTQAADTVVRVVDQVKAKTTGPAITVARAVVYGLLAASLAAVALVLFAILAVRLVDVYLPDAWFGERHTWAAHLLIGAVFTLVGLFLWSKRHHRSA